MMKKLLLFFIFPIFIFGFTNVNAQYFFKKKPYENNLEFGLRGTSLKINPSKAKDTGDYKFDPRRKNVMISAVYFQYNRIIKQRFKVSAGLSFPLFVLRHSYIVNNSPYYSDYSKERVYLVGYNEKYVRESANYKHYYINPLYLKGIAHIPYKKWWLFGIGIETGIQNMKVTSQLESVTYLNWYDSSRILRTSEVESTELKGQKITVYNRFYPYIKPIINAEYAQYTIELHPMPGMFAFSLGYKFN